MGKHGFISYRRIRQTIGGLTVVETEHIVEYEVGAASWH